MNKEDELKVYNDAIDFFGDISQKIMVIEEMSELTKELCKDLRDRGNTESIAEEIADVEITLAQIKMIYNIHDNVEQFKDYKLKRFASRMEELKKNKQM